MEIARERFLDDAGACHVTLALRSRTTTAHSVLTSLTADERDHLGRVLAHAMDDIERLMRQAQDRGAGAAAS
jgi:hypothetical protein